MPFLVVIAFPSTADFFLGRVGGGGSVSTIQGLQLRSPWYAVNFCLFAGRFIRHSASTAVPSVPCLNDRFISLNSASFSAVHATFSNAPRRRFVFCQGAFIFIFGFPPTSSSCWHLHIFFLDNHFGSRLFPLSCRSVLLQSRPLL